jgi:hypothetical protein
MTTALFAIQPNVLNEQSNDSSSVDKALILESMGIHLTHSRSFPRSNLAFRIEDWKTTTLKTPASNQAFLEIDVLTPPITGCAFTVSSGNVG